jgi:hypothetical protein
MVKKMSKPGPEGSNIEFYHDTSPVQLRWLQIQLSNVQAIKHADFVSKDGVQLQLVT